MAEFTEYYDDIEQRDVIYEDYKSQGLRLIHDTFDTDWKVGDDPHGTLIFTDAVPSAPPEPEPVRDLTKEIDNLTVRITKLESSIAS